MTRQDRALAVAGGLVGGAAVATAIWLGRAQIVAGGITAAYWWNALRGTKILALNRAGVDHGTGT